MVLDQRVVSVDKTTGGTARGGQECAWLLPCDGKQLNSVGGNDGRVTFGKAGKALVLPAIELFRCEIIPAADVSSKLECVMVGRL